MSENADVCAGVAAGVEMVSLLSLVGITNLDGPVHAIVTGEQVDAVISSVLSEQIDT
jgi:hypothetical protein